MKSYNKAEISIGTNTGSLRKRHDFTPTLIAPIFVLHPACFLSVSTPCILVRVSLLLMNG